MRPSGFESRTKAAFEMVVIHRFAEVANDPILQGTLSDDLIRVCGNEDRRDRMPRIDQASVELDPGHSRASERR